VSISEEARHGLYTKLEEVLGPEHAATMMGSIPPVGWGDVATRRDLEMLETRLIGEMDRRSGETDRRLGEMHRSMIYANLGAVLATASLVFAAVRIS
jgi:hypothetical protein